MNDAESTASLSEHVYEAMNEWFAANGGGMALSAVFVIDTIDGDGGEQTRFYNTPGQSPARTLGLIEHARLFFRECVSRDLMPLVFEDADEGDDC